VIVDLLAVPEANVLEGRPNGALVLMSPTL
jgi:hypothetical protein